MQGFTLPAGGIRATHMVDEQGRVTGRRPNASTRVEPVAPDWEALDCPALGLYPVVAPLETWLPHYAARYQSLSDEERRRGRAYVEAYGAWTRAQREAFAAVPRNEVVEFPGTGHYFSLQRPAAVAAAIQEFVGQLQWPAPSRDP